MHFFSNTKIQFSSVVLIKLVYKCLMWHKTSLNAEDLCRKSTKIPHSMCVCVSSYVATHEGFMQDVSDYSFSVIDLICDDDFILLLVTSCLFSLIFLSYFVLYLKISQKKHQHVCFRIKNWLLLIVSFWISDHMIWYLPKIRAKIDKICSAAFHPHLSSSCLFFLTRSFSSSLSFFLFILHSSPPYCASTIPSFLSPFPLLGCNGVMPPSIVSPTPPPLHSLSNQGQMEAEMEWWREGGLGLVLAVS